MRFYKYRSFILIHIYDIPEDLFANIKCAERFRKDHYPVTASLIKEVPECIHILYKCPDQDVPVIRRKSILEFLSADFLVFIEVIIYDTPVIYFHIYAVLAVSVPDKYQIQIHAHELLKGKMISVIIKRLNTGL